MSIVIPTLLIVLPAVAAAQATVEAAAGVSRAATTATSVADPGQKIAKGVAGAIDRLNRTLQQTSEGKSSPKAVAAPTASGRQPATISNKAGESSLQKVTETQYEPPSGIRDGMEVPELVRRFGPPALRINTGADETYCYVAKDGATVDATVRDNKVVTVLRKGDSSSGPTATAQQK